ncbi:MAG: PilZ domain-containing protein [Candidatus Sulfotelmatobacter sp.]
MDSINTRRWPRYHVQLPVLIAANTSATKVVVPGLVCELSRSGMELYGGVNLQPGEMMEVEFQIAEKIRVGGVVRNRSGFCFGLEFRTAWTEPEAATEGLESLILQRHESYLRELQHEFDRSLQTILEMRKCRKAIERIANALDNRL